MIYVVVPFRGREKIGTAIKKAKLPVYEYDGEDSHVFFVSYGGTTQDLSEKVGLKGRREASGVVLPVSNYSGFASPDLWEWLREYELLF